jgi:pimeloyl-ACP methyl ester carboxylesterase
VSNSLTAKRDQVVHLVHGIRTHADWQDRVIAILEGVEGVTVVPTRYGKFGLVSFLLPGPTRNPPIQKTLSGLLDAQKQAKESNSTLTVIAHSYGTHAIFKILSNNPAIKIDNLILCGAVKGQECNWQSIREANDINVLINDYGAMDLWPAMAASITWGYGNGGTYGIGELL